MTNINDVGATTAEYIISWFANPQSEHLLSRLKAAGVSMTAVEDRVDSRFEGMTFVLTGTLSSYTREEKFNIAKKHLIPKQLKKNGEKYSMECSGTYSQTTRRHINRFTKEFTGENMYYSCRDAVNRGDVFVDWIPAKPVIEQANRYKQYGKICRN